ncbi:alpha/beta hydrolase [Streptosporangium oxazolinicum]|uniref:Alpha/beta hydrolase n=1 Tax=Streptosporangium oxazolinicum TaxID=909287 RepID=A0ABP8B5G2_9ACTN
MATATVSSRSRGTVAVRRELGVMAGYAEVGGVRTWYDEYGTGEPLVLLHPGMVDARAWAPNAGALAERFRVFTPDRRGHGRTPDVDGPITYEAMARDTIAFLETVVGGPAHLAGCSDGVTVALLVAMFRPDLARRLVLAAGVFHRDGWVPGTAEMDDASAGFLAAGYGEVSPDGPEHFPVVAAKLARMHAEEPVLADSELKRVTSRTLVMVGDDDEVSLEHAVAMYRALPDAELAVVPGTSHGLLVEKPEFCNKMIVDFLALDPVPTLAPIRRAVT